MIDRERIKLTQYDTFQLSNFTTRHRVTLARATESLCHAPLSHFATRHRVTLPRATE